jgi:hypothetical protein
MLQSIRYLMGACRLKTSTSFNINYYSAINGDQSAFIVTPKHIDVS